LPVFAKHVEEVKKELLDKKGIVVDNVIMTSDERDPNWWADVLALGWKRVDYSETTEQYGPWYVITSLSDSL
jgi:hypothetical protein